LRVNVQGFSGGWADDRPYDVRFRERLETIGRWSSLHDLGFNVIPAHPQTKATCRCWKTYQAERQPRRVFDRWFLGDFRLPGTSEAMLVVGETPGIAIVVLDGDDPEAVAIIQDRCPPTPMTVKTGRGSHFYYAHPGNGWIKQRTKTIIAGVTYPIDLKADGSVVVAPGSRHASGHLYETTRPWSREMIGDLPVYDPAWLPHEDAQEHRDLPAVSSPSEHAGGSAHEEFVAQVWLPPVVKRSDLARRYLEKVPGTRAGEGNARRECFRLALALAWGFALPLDEAVECLAAWGRKHDNTDPAGDYDPWTEQEIAVEVRSASATTYRGKPGDKLFGA
jgi:Bifunctional DNA primase/polymerase, N-terminal